MKQFMSLIAAFGLTLTLVLSGTSPAYTQTEATPDAGLLVVYGLGAPTREGDTDNRETLFFSVPDDLGKRIYVRIFDPETGGEHDFVYGGTADSETLFRVIGGDGAFDGSQRPAPVANNQRGKRLSRDDVLAQAGGTLLRDKSYGSDARTDGRWSALGAVRARQGEQIDGRAWFRLEIIGAKGNDGNGYTLAISTERDKNVPPQGLEFFGFQPTLRWPGDGPATRVGFKSQEGAPIDVQVFDGANADIAVTQMFTDLDVESSGQDRWSVTNLTPAEGDLALTYSGGFETPNDITLSIFDAEGAALPITMPPRRAPVPQRPVAVASARALADCASVSFNGAQSTGSDVLRHLWSFGDGTTGEGAVVVHQFAQSGTYTARLSVLEPGDGPGRGSFAEIPVTVRVPPTAVSGPDRVVAPGEVIAFDGGGSLPSGAPIASYLWTFGDGSVAQGAQAQKAYDTSGSYLAVLRVADATTGPCNTSLSTSNITVNAAPVAVAGVDQSVTVGSAVALDGVNSLDVDGQIVSFEWDMGDGTILTGAQVSHTYATSGTFRVVLRVRDDSDVGNSTASDSILVQVNSPPVPQINAPDRILAVGETDLFDATGSTDGDGQILSYLWDFGDGAMGSGERVTYAWASAGTYRVTLTVVDDSGTTTAMQSTSTMITINAPPVAQAGPDQSVTASEVAFDGTGSSDSDGKIARYLWNFGDGNFAEGPRPVHAFARSGVYEVALTVVDDSGAPQSTHRDTLTVRINASPIADAGPAQVVAPDQSVVLDAGASIDPDGGIASYVWTFPDGSQKSGERIEQAFGTVGRHRIQLTVTDDFAANPAQDDADTFVTVNAPPVARAGNDLLVAPGTVVLLDGHRSFDPDGTITNWEWEFDDIGGSLSGALVERPYPTAGVWSAQLVVTDNSGVANSTSLDGVTIRVNSAPVAEAGPDIYTEELFVSFDGGKSSDADGDALIYTWDFGDGSDPVRGRIPRHAFPRPGTFPVTLTVDDATGLTNATAVDALTVTINAPPVAVAGRNRDVCSGEAILFDASASSDPDGDLLRYLWDFGDGESATTINPTKTYEFPGVYSVTLTVEDESGGARGHDIDRIAAVIHEGPIADAGPDRTVCSGQHVRFNGTGSTDTDGTVNSFDWSFGDGKSASGSRPLHVFDRQGTYEVTLTITGEGGELCSPVDTDSATFTVLKSPHIEILAAGHAATQTPVTFTAKLRGLDGATPKEIYWRFSDGTELQGETVRHSFANPGPQDVIVYSLLEGGDSPCREIEANHRINVNAAPVAMVTAPLTAAAGDVVVFDGGNSGDTDGAITSFDWDFGDGNTAKGVLGAHRYEQAGIYEATLRVVDNAGVGNSTQTAVHRIVVTPSPLADLKEPAPVCAGDTLEWQVTGPSAPTALWRFGATDVETGPLGKYTFDSVGLFPVSVLLNDGLGLPNSKKSEEIYVRVNAPPVGDAGPDRVVCPGDEVFFEARANDLDGEITGVTWQFSDGQTFEGPEISRSFDTPGQHNVTLILKDDSATSCDTGTDVARILVNSPPTVDAGADAKVMVGAAHDVVVFDATSAKDPDGHGVSLLWDFGDGASAAGARSRHRFASPGDYTVTVTASDGTGLSCGAASDTATITAVARN